MEHYAGIDVSLERSSVCVVDGGGKIVVEAKGVNRTGFPGGPDFWKDGVHDEQDEEIEGVSGGAA